jgi:SAM-dependent methyltransferase
MTNQWNAQTYDRNARFVSDLGSPVLELLAPKTGERILDLGCGDGVLTTKIQEFGCTLVGIDPSEDFVAAAVGNGVLASVGDARRLEFHESFDAVFSNAVLHWIPEAQSVADGVFRALKTNGRFVAEFGGHGNIAAIMTALVATLRHYDVPLERNLGWYYPTVGEYSLVLQQAGFIVDSIELIPRPTCLPTGMIGWLETFRGSYLREKLGDKADVAIEEVVENLRFALCDRSGNWTADYVRLRFRAFKP